MVFHLNLNLGISGHASHRLEVQNRRGASCLRFHFHFYSPSIARALSCTVLASSLLLFDLHCFLVQLHYTPYRSYTLRASFWTVPFLFWSSVRGAFHLKLWVVFFSSIFVCFHWYCYCIDYLFAFCCFW